MITRRAFLLGAGATIVIPVVAETRQTGKVWRIGFLKELVAKAPTSLSQGQRGRRPREGGLRSKSSTSACAGASGCRPGWRTTAATAR